MRQSAIVIFVPDDEISDECGRRIAQAICEDLHCDGEDITLHQLNGKELNQAIITGIIAAEGKPQQKENKIADAVLYLKKKYPEKTLAEFRIHILKDGARVFSPDVKTTAEVKALKNAICIIGTNPNEAIRYSYEIGLDRGLNEDFIDVVSNIHQFYSKMYV